MTYRLFLDDERFPPNDGNEWKIARSFQEAQILYFNYGVPSFISFDHDLGDQVKTGYDFAKWLVEKDIECGFNFLPDTFSYYVHSQNPVGAKNIRDLIDNYFDFRRINRFSTNK